MWPIAYIVVSLTAGLALFLRPYFRSRANDRYVARHVEYGVTIKFVGRLVVH